MRNAKKLGEAPAALKARWGSVRFPHIMRGLCDFSLKAFRTIALTKGIAKSHKRNRKRPFNADLPRWAMKALGVNLGQCPGLELVTSSILGFIFLLRISEIGNLENQISALQKEKECESQFAPDPQRPPRRGRVCFEHYVLKRANCARVYG